MVLRLAVVSVVHFTSFLQRTARPFEQQTKSYNGKAIPMLHHADEVGCVPHKAVVRKLMLDRESCTNLATTDLRM